MNIEHDTTTAQTLGQALMLKGWMLASAESCTGGLLSAAITDVAGSSQWFERGFVTYSNDAKIDHLQVSAETLERYGAVSEETAMEMAAGALTVTPHAHVAVSTTGVAGPGGGTPGKPVGMVCFGFARRAENGIVVRAVTHIFDGDRLAIRAAAVEYALLGTLELAQAK